MEMSPQFDLEKQGYTFTHKSYSTVDDIQVQHNGKHAGHMYWGDKGVNDIYVEPEHRNKGVATHLWNMANRLHTEGAARKPIHSTERTAAGMAWSKKVGGPSAPGKVKRLPDIA